MGLPSKCRRSSRVRMLQVEMRPKPSGSSSCSPRTRNIGDRILRKFLVSGTHVTLHLGLDSCGNSKLDISIFHVGTFHVGFDSRYATSRIQQGMNFENTWMCWCIIAKQYSHSVVGNELYSFLWKTNSECEISLDILEVRAIWSSWSSSSHNSWMQYQPSLPGPKCLNKVDLAIKDYIAKHLPAAAEGFEMLPLEDKLGLRHRSHVLQIRV